MSKRSFQSIPSSSLASSPVSSDGAKCSLRRSSASLSLKDLCYRTTSLEPSQTHHEVPSGNALNLSSSSPALDGATATTMPNQHQKQIPFLPYFLLAATALQLPMCYEELVNIFETTTTSYQQAFPILILVGVLPSLFFNFQKNKQQAATTVEEGCSLSSLAEDSLLSNDLDEHCLSGLFRRSCSLENPAGSESGGALPSPSPSSSSTSSSSSSSAEPAFEWGQFADLDEELPCKDMSFVISGVDTTSFAAPSSSSCSSSSTQLWTLFETEQEEDVEDAVYY